MSDINRITVSGNVGTEPETRTIGSGESATQLATFSLANSIWENGEEATQWLYINLWGKQANFAPFLRVGMKVFIEGRLRIREHDGKYYTQINADRIVGPNRADRGDDENADRPSTNRGSGVSRGARRNAGSDAAAGGSFDF